MPLNEIFCPGRYTARSEKSEIVRSSRACSCAENRTRSSETAWTAFPPGAAASGRSHSTRTTGSRPRFSPETTVSPSASVRTSGTARRSPPQRALFQADTRAPSSGAPVTASTARTRSVPSASAQGCASRIAATSPTHANLQLPALSSSPKEWSFSAKNRK